MLSRAVLPDDFDARGLLPSGDYEVSFAELRESLLVRGPRTPVPHWDAAWRLRLVDRAEILVDQLWAVGISNVYLVGSFVEDKPHPNEIDGYFVCDASAVQFSALQAELNLLDPHRSWTWDPRTRKVYRGYLKRQLPMWHAYRVELYPEVGQQNSGIRDRHGRDLSFPEAFRQQRGTDEPKGIVKLRTPTTNL